MYYFVSDIHLGSGGGEESRRVERRFVEWLDRVSQDAEAIFLCGDIFDMWFEYRRVVPKGFVRTLGAISRATDRGVRVVYMVGNHDMWMSGYLQEECGVELYKSPQVFDLGGVKVHVAHGDNLRVVGDWRLKLVNKIFRSRAIQSLTRLFVHPDLLLKFGQWWSSSSRKRHCAQPSDNTIEARGVADLLHYSAERQSKTPCDLYVYGHLHQKIEYQGDGYRVVFMNDWAGDPHYVELSGSGEATLKSV